MMRRALTLLFLPLLVLVACDEEPVMDEETYARMTVELVAAGFLGSEADAVYEEYGVTPEEYDAYSRELEKDPERQRRVGELILAELGDDWEEWGYAFGEAFAKLGYNFGEIAAQFGKGFIEGFMEFAPQMEAAFEEMARGLEESLGDLDGEIEEDLAERTDDEPEAPADETTQ
jgi:hypothetical protein